MYAGTISDSTTQPMSTTPATISSQTATTVAPGMFTHTL